MTDTNSLPTSSELAVFQWSDPDNPRPTLTRKLSTSGGTAYWSAAPVDKAGSIVTNPFLFIVKIVEGQYRGYTLLVQAPNGADGSAGLSGTGTVVGIAHNGIDWTTQVADLAVDAPAGSPIACADAAVMFEMFRSAMQGGIATGGSSFRIGPDSTGDITVFFDNGDANPPFIQWDQTGSEILASTDGVSTFILGTGAGSITGGDGITVTAGDIDIDTSDTTVFNATATASRVPLGDGSAKLDSDWIDIGNGLETNAGQIRVKQGSGTTVDANGVSISNLRTLSGVAYETITDGAPLVEIPVEVQWYDQMDDSNLIALGDSNANWSHAIKFTATENTTITDRNLRLRKNGSATQTITVSLQADSSGEPSGTALVSNTLAASGLTTSFATENFDFGAGQAVVKGTDYWVVIEVDNDDAANYVEVQVASGFDEYFVTAERLTFDLTGGTWGGSVTNAPFWCWGDENFGMALVEADRSIVSKCWSVVGFAAAAYSAGDDAQYYHEFTDTAAGITLAKNQTVWLSTSGQVTLTPATFSLYTTSVGLTNSTRGWNYRLGRTIVDDAGNILLKIEKGPKRIFLSGSLAGSTAQEILTFISPGTIRAIGQDTTGIAPYDVSFGVFAGGDQASVTDQVTSGENELYNDGTRTVTVANESAAGFTLNNSTASAIGLILEINEI